MKRIFLAISALILVVWIIGGCSSSTQPKTTATTATDFGSYTTANEQPAFGDTTIAQQTEDATAYDDPCGTPHIEDSLENLSSSSIYALRVVWGNLEKDSAITTSTDWSGKITIDTGAIIVTHTIRFERGQDSLIFAPRESLAVPNYVQWVSHTSVNYDGLALRIFVPADSTDSNKTATLSFAATPFSITFTQSQLENLDTLIVLGTGNAVSFQSVLWNKNSTLRGPMAGVWGKDDSGNGVFYGAWMSVNGSVIGTVKGNWATDSTGRNTFVGKYIDNSGVFQGLLKGTWFKSGQGHEAEGHFTGSIYDASETVIGAVAGHYKLGDREQMTGYFAGRWCLGSGCIIDDSPPPKGDSHTPR